ncbi:hypothetical protein N7539_003012 [Penicillium diatomitis]|uniref:Uncharacterized protein n=1 Tax=Penicillium diatomitis TaxID=2819901 RepID=A0A9W9XFR4_9EURO|nr:uncharacterized protein N7539_003012 [Penicillium diatomitis]KAJ5491445.1 hypothetical protein N7539_003012 [Penicillium diatomitis]
MLAVRDQENLVNTHQTAAAAKPLNQGLHRVPPKTPGKSVPLNDENNPRLFGKGTIKGNKSRQENGKPASNAFVTPGETRQRAVLGNKTTNLKTNAFKTPGPFGGTGKQEKTNNRRTSTAQRIKRAAPVTQQAQTKVFTDVTHDEVPDIEYMPPKPTGACTYPLIALFTPWAGHSQLVDLLDEPDDVTYDTTFPQFQPKNRALGLESVYGQHDHGSDGLTKKQRKFLEDSAKCDALVNETIMRQLEAVRFSEFTETAPTQATRQPLQHTHRRAPSSNVRPTRPVSTLRSREAAAALAMPRPSTAPGQPIAVPKSRVVSASSSLLSQQKPRAPTNPSSMRNAAAAATSNTTVGYSKGRSVSSTLRETTTARRAASAETLLSPETYIQLYGKPPLDSDMWIRCKAAGCFDAPEESTSSPQLDSELPIFEEDEDAANFQLAL